MLRGKFAPFFQKSKYRVINALQDNKTIKPTVRINADYELIIALTLAKGGLFGGNPHTVLLTPVDIVLEAYNYELFTHEYESTYMELNDKRN